jgi:hypothetical protein
MGKKLWIVGRNKDGTGKDWDFQGVFDSEDLAIAACRDGTYFLAPACLNEEIPHETSDFPLCRYPKAQ